MNGLRAIVLLVACVAADWPQFLGPKRNGGTSEIVKPWTSAPEVLWRLKLGNGFSAPVCTGGKVFVHTRGPDATKEEEEVLALDAVSGKVLWRDRYTRPKYDSVLGTGPRATPTVVGKRLFTLGINGVLSCYATDTGKRHWQIDLYGHFKADLPGFAVCGSPLVVGNRVIVSVGGKGRCIVALDTDTGAVAWQALDDAASTSSPVLFAGGVRPKGTAPDVVFLTPLRLVGLDPLDGTLRWERPLVFQPQGTSPTPLVLGDVVVTSTQAHGAVAVRIDRTGAQPTATAAWQNKKMKSYFSSGVTASDLLVLVTNKVEALPVASLTCLDPKTGTVHWTKDGAGYFHAGVIRTGDGKLLVLSDGGTLSLLTIDAKAVKEVARAKVCGGTLVSPALVGGRLYVRDDKEILCLRLGE